MTRLLFLLLFVPALSGCDSDRVSSGDSRIEELHYSNMIIGGRFDDIERLYQFKIDSLKIELRGAETYIETCEELIKKQDELIKVICEKYEITF